MLGKQRNNTKKTCSPQPCLRRWSENALTRSVQGWQTWQTLWANINYWLLGGKPNNWPVVATPFLWGAKTQVLVIAP